jgi:cytochrome P450
MVSQFSYMLLSKNPSVVQKLREEHNRIFDSNIERTIEILRESPHKLNELDYTTAVIKETLRLFPVGFGVRVAPPGSALSLNGETYAIDNNMCIVPLWYHMHYSSSYFKNPAIFDPGRFLDSSSHPEVARGTFRSFSRGPRGCAGQDLAIDELRTILLMTVREFDFEYAHMQPNKEARVSFTELDTVYGDVVFQELGLEAKPRGGMMMRVRKVRA